MTKEQLVSILNIDPDAIELIQSESSACGGILFAQRFDDINDLCIAFAHAHSMLEGFGATINAFDGADDNEDGYYYLYIQF